MRCARGRDAINQLWDALALPGATAEYPEMAGAGWTRHFRIPALAEPWIATPGSSCHMTHSRVGTALHSGIYRHIGQCVRYRRNTLYFLDIASTRFS